MGSCCSRWISRDARTMSPTFCGMSCDDLFAYQTTKQVRIRDFRLGLLQYSLMILIFLYIIVGQLFGQLQYLKFTRARNTIRLTLQEPTLHNCNPNKNSCSADFPLIGELDYCCQNRCSEHTGGVCRCADGRRFDNFICAYIDGFNAGRVLESSILVTSFTHAYVQVMNESCFNGSFPTAANSCAKLWITQSETSAFTVGVENYTLLLDHSLMSDGWDGISTQEMSGLLFVDSGTEIQERLCAETPGALDANFHGQLTDKAPCFLPPAQSLGIDIFSIGVLLQSMGISLDVESKKGSGHTLRYEGLGVEIDIEYSNSVRWVGRTEPWYVYKPLIVPSAEYKLSQIDDLSYPDRRVRRSQHGILFQVKASGHLAKFDFTSLLVQLTTSLTLLAVATVIVNFFAQHILKHRVYYAQALFDQTTVFSHIVELERKREDYIDGELRAFGCSVVGTKQDKILRLVDLGWTRERLDPGAELGLSAW